MCIRIGIAGYGNLGRGVESALAHSDDMKLIGVFTRRDPRSLKTKTGAPVFSIESAEAMKEEIDVMILCGGSASDLPEQTAQLASCFNVVDSFDTHARIPEHFQQVNEISCKNHTVSIISVGWDPGLFSLARMYGQAVLPDGCDYTFWGKGISQGHSDAVRRIPGVKDARQYTVPSEEALESVRSGANPELTVRQKHTRECFVVAKEGADLKAIENAIKTMPDYFADYDTAVHFISQEELNSKHSGMPHGGIVLRTGKTGLNGENSHTIEYRLTLDSNPEFTAGVLTAYARAAYRLSKDCNYGCKTVLDIPPAYIHYQDADTLRRSLL